MLPNPYMNPFINQFPYMDAHEMNLDWIIKTVKMLFEEMKTFESINTVEYKGEWNITSQYPAWSIVYDLENGYMMISKKPVPAGISITNRSFWDFISPYRIDTTLDPDSYNAIANKTVYAINQELNASINNVNNALTTRINSNSDRIDTLDDNVANLSSTLTSEQTIREETDTQLAGRITDLTEDLTDETTERINTDNLLTARINEIASLPEGSTSGDAELADIRVGYDGESYATAGDAVREQIDGVHKDIDNIVTFSNGINLIDPSLLTVGAVQADGSIIAPSSWGNYRTSDFIPIEADTDYAFAQYFKDTGETSTSRRGYLLYDATREPITASYTNNADIPTIIENTSAAYIRVFFRDNCNAQLEKGNVITPYEPFVVHTQLKENIQLSDIMREQVDIEISKKSVGVVDPMRLQISNNNITVINGNLIRTYLKHSTTNNHNFNFEYAYLDNVRIKASTDDITPLRIGLTGTNNTWTIGANHCWPALMIPGTSLTIDDTGSTWSDGVNTYTLVKVESGTAYFLYPASWDGNRINITITNPVANLTHVSGATHTTSISISSAAQDQLSYSINDNIVKIYIDEREITEDGIHNCYKANIKESYNILDYVDIITYMQNHIGADFSSDTVRHEIDSIIAVNNMVEITASNEVVYTKIKAIKNCYLVNCGFMQASVLTASNSGTVYRYLNGVASGNNFASDTLVDMTNYSTSYDIRNTMLINADKPTNRCVDICKDGSGNILYGFTFGFVPDMSYGSDEYRKNLPTLWDLRNTRKSYPYCIYNTEFNSNQFIDVVGYRHYIMPGQDITNRSSIVLANKRYYFIDAHSAYSSEIDDENYGVKIKELDNYNTIHSDVIGATGLSIGSTNSYSAAVLKTE